MATIFHCIEPDNEADYGITRNPAVKVSFFTGKVIASPLPEPLVFRVDHPPDVAPPHFLGDRIPVCSRLLLGVLEAAGVGNIQSIPAVLENPDVGARWTDYVAINVLGLRAAARLDQSTFDTLVGGDAQSGVPPLLAFHEIVLDAAKVKGCLMFRLAESPSTLLIHDSVNAYIDAHAPSEGWGFDTIEVRAV
jgi:hypothetical protein